MSKNLRTLLIRLSRARSYTLPPSKSFDDASGILRAGQLDSVISRFFTRTEIRGRRSFSDNIDRQGKIYISRVFTRVLQGSDTKGVAGIKPANLDAAVAEAVVNSVFNSKELVRLPVAEKPRENVLAGEVVTISEGQESPVKLAEKDIRKAPIIFCGGLGCSMTAGRIKRNLEDIKGCFDRDVVSYVSPLEKDELMQQRYDMGMLVYAGEEDYIPKPVVEHFFDKVMKPKFFDDNGELLSLDKIGRFVLVNHSLAAREGICHGRYFEKMLREKGLSDDQVDAYMKKVLVFNIASPMLLEDDELSGSRFPTVNIVSVCDTGSKKPKTWFEKLLFNPDCYKGVCNFKYGDRDAIITLPPGVIPRIVVEGDKIKRTDNFGHSVGAYAKGIADSEISHLIGEMTQKFMNSPSDAEASQVFEEQFHRSRSLPDQIPAKDQLEAAKLLIDSLRLEEVKTHLAIAVEEKAKEKSQSGEKKEKREDSASEVMQKLLQTEAEQREIAKRARKAQKEESKKQPPSSGPSRPKASKYFTKPPTNKGQTHR